MRPNFRDMSMEPRPDWNAIGPRLPAWFRLRLSRIDPRLVLQFIPARTLDCREGVDPCQFPQGVWAICRLMRGTGWLSKRWTWSLSDQHGRYQEPGADTIELLRMARDLWRRDSVDAMERRFEEAIEEVQSERAQQSKAHMREYIQQLCRAHGFVNNHSRVFTRESAN